VKNFLLRNKYYYSTILVFIIVGGIVLILNTKAEVTLWVVNEHWSHLFDNYVLDVNAIGSTFFSVAAVAFLWIEKGWRVALKAALCFIAVMLVTQFGKHVLFPGTLRPTLYFEEGTLRLIGVKQLATESFPSGHTSASFALATFFSLFFKNKRGHWLFALLAFAVSYGRIYMSQHFITDVYAGMLIGVGITTLVYCFYPKKWEAR
jgi:undecaprenyl-diphosphatase